KGKASGAHAAFEATSSNSKAGRSVFWRRVVTLACCKPARLTKSRRRRGVYAERWLSVARACGPNSHLLNSASLMMPWRLLSRAAHGAKDGVGAGLFDDALDRGMRQGARLQEQLHAQMLDPDTQLGRQEFDGVGADRQQRAGQIVKVGEPLEHETVEASLALLI